MLTVDFKNIELAFAQNYLQQAVTPRPICFASTINLAGIVNLSPFSFFNLFSIDPPILIFSPSRRGRNNTIKHTLENILEVKEVVINLVSYAMVQQVSLSSCEYPTGVDEFLKSGFTKEASQLIKPPRVKESMVQFECKVIEVKPLGEKGGAGNLVIAEVLLMHINEKILNEAGEIDPDKMDLVARLGANNYTRVNAASIFEIEKPTTKIAIGVDALPESIRNSNILTGNNLGQLGNVFEIPDVAASFYDDKLKNIVQYYSINPDDMEKELHIYAKELLDNNKVAEAWQVLLALI